MSNRAATGTIDLQAVADEAVAAMTGGRQIATFSSRQPGLDFDAAYRATYTARSLREAAGAMVIGRKIGFTNRTIWAEYRVSAPMWGYVFDRTAREIADIDGAFPLAGLSEPRIEPEIIFGLGTAPSPGMDERALLGCIDWIAHGFEIVQSIYPGWAFTLPDTVIANGLHGALLIGPRHAITENRADWEPVLSTFEIDLKRNGEVVDRGHAANVLDGPLSALRHLNDLLASDSANPPLAAGELVTTGTLTRAFPIVPGETWSTAPLGIALDGIEVRFS